MKLVLRWVGLPLVARLAPRFVALNEQAILNQVRLGLHQEARVHLRRKPGRVRHVHAQVNLGGDLVDILPAWPARSRMRDLDQLLRDRVLGGARQLVLPVGVVAAGAATHFPRAMEE